MDKPKIVIFATGGAGPYEGGSGAGELILKQTLGGLQADIVAIVSSHPQGGVKSKADSGGIPFIHMEKPFTAEKYQDIVTRTQADLIAGSGRIHHIKGIDWTKCINIHPGPLGKYGGKGMYGDAVHKAIYEDLQVGEINRTCITMHFVTPVYDDPQGLIFQLPIELRSDPEIMQHIDNPEQCIAAIKKKVNKAEHQRQRYITNMVANQQITAQRDEENQKIKITFPQDYTHQRPVSLDTQEPYGEF